jgi:hypothetical protein
MGGPFTTDDSELRHELPVPARDTQRCLRTLMRAAD